MSHNRELQACCTMPVLTLMQFLQDITDTLIPSDLQDIRKQKSFSFFPVKGAVLAISGSSGGGVDYYTLKSSGSPCYWDRERKDCAVCRNGGCPCPQTNKGRCVKCGTSQCDTGTVTPIQDETGGLLTVCSTYETPSSSSWGQAVSATSPMYNMYLTSSGRPCGDEAKITKDVPNHGSGYTDQTVASCKKLCNDNPACRAATLYAGADNLCRIFSECSNHYLENNTLTFEKAVSVSWKVHSGSAVEPGWYSNDLNESAASWQSPIKAPSDRYSSGPVIPSQGQIYGPLPLYNKHAQYATSIWGSHSQNYAYFRLRVEEREEPNVEHMAFAGNGCCRFDGWEARYVGLTSPSECLSHCLADDHCVAVDFTADSRCEATANSSMSGCPCYAFYGVISVGGLRIECSKAGRCFRKETYRSDKAAITQRSGRLVAATVAVTAQVVQSNVGSVLIQHHSKSDITAQIGTKYQQAHMHRELVEGLQPREFVSRVTA